MFNNFKIIQISTLLTKKKKKAQRISKTNTQVLFSTQYNNIPNHKTKLQMPYLITILTKNKNRQEIYNLEN